MSSPIDQPEVFPSTPLRLSSMRKLIRLHEEHPITFVSNSMWMVLDGEMESRSHVRLFLHASGSITTPFTVALPA